MTVKKAYSNVDNYIEEFLDALNEIDTLSIKEVVKFLRCRNYDKIFTVGNGGSMSTAEHMAADLNKWSNMNHGKKIMSLCLNSNSPEISALTNDVGRQNVYYELLKTYRANRQDVLIAYSVHGGVGKESGEDWSQNLTKAIDYVNSIGGVTIGVTGSGGGAFKSMCKYCVVVPSDSTPVIEGIHSVISHIIVDSIRLDV